MKYVKRNIKLFRDAARIFKQHEPLMLASSTAFFTVFALPMMIILVVNVLSIYFIRTKQATSPVIQTIRNVFGEEATDSVLAIVVNFENLGSSGWITLIGILFLIFVATNLFKVVKLSIDRIWGLRAKKVKGKLWSGLKARAISLAIIFFTGLLFLISTLLDTFLNTIENYINHIIPELDSFLILTLSKILALFLVTVWFTIMFRYLPDARIRWKITFHGALLTSVLFVLGKIILDRVLIQSHLDNIFEASASIVLIMLFIFYSSLIMYFGASYTKALADAHRYKIEPLKHAERYAIVPEKDVVDVATKIENANA